jgi:RNA polymerase sigma-70 factor (ECF subfamily)
MTAPEEVFTAHRPRLLGIAYSMLGALGEAEDVVQDAWLRWQKADTEAIADPRAFLVTVTTRLAIDRLRSARARREQYVGPWLPDPLVADADHDPADLVAEAEQLTLALLVTLERLNPVERAVLILRDVFDLEYAEIADAVERTPVNCRKIAVRARERVRQPVRRHEPAPEAADALVAAFMAAVGTGDVAGIRALLAEDAVLWSDGGGVVTAARKPVAGAELISRFLVGIQKGGVPEDLGIATVRVNGEPGVHLTGEGAHSVWALEIRDNRIAALRVVVNPEKLRHLEAA